MCNILATGRADADTFESSKSCDAGVTQEVQVLQAHAFGNRANRLLEIYDIPGIYELGKSVANSYKALTQKISDGKAFDAVAIVYKSSDYRGGNAIEKLATNTIKVLFQGLTNIIAIITHCDQLRPTSEWIAEKNKSFKGLNISKTFLFDKSSSSLAPFIEHINKNGQTAIFTPSPSGIASLTQTTSHANARMITGGAGPNPEYVKQQELQEMKRLKALQDANKKFLVDYKTNLKQTPLTGRNSSWSDNRVYYDNTYILVSENPDGTYRYSQMLEFKGFSVYSNKFSTEIIVGYQIKYERNVAGQDPVYNHQCHIPRGPVKETTFQFEPGEYITHVWINSGGVVDSMRFCTNKKRGFGFGGNGGTCNIMQTVNQQGKHARILAFGCRHGPYDFAWLHGYYVVENGPMEATEVILPGQCIIF
ncbi:hypothetical protein FGO68_gene77 [Halteria grandinella]|uniref:Jacalin-type lectin domain-containing protein n=1 Tax=Halteria grandinella TaxID=5974 RepID=A0A8J8NNA3_HALGN|nr:hypothetical protein FGO68_gene77 [Halteria grandinella]